MGNIDLSLWVWMFTNPIILFMIALFLFLFIYQKKIVGLAGEFWVKQELKKLPSENYKIINDVMVYSNNSTHQIDHIIVSKFGIFVIETKQYNGYITGNEYDKKWIQHYGKKKYYFNNPIHQNYGHVMSLKEIFNFNEELFIPIVCIPSTAKVKVKSKSHVARINNLLDIITSYKAIKLDENDISFIVKKINECNITDRKLRKEHIKNIKNNIIKDDSNKCPRCGGNLVERNGNLGIFIGCSNYPKCKYTENKK